MKLHLIVSTLVVISSSFFLNVVLAEEPKAIWGTDGAGITKSEPQIKTAPATVKPAVTEKQILQTNMEKVKEPTIAKPTTTPDAITGRGLIPAPVEGTDQITGQGTKPVPVNTSK